MKFTFVKILVLSLLTLASTQAFAYSECTLTVSSTYSGDGMFWIQSSAGAAYVMDNAPSAKQIFTSVLTSVVMGKKITVRFAEKGVNCNSFGARGDVLGVWYF